MLIINPSFIISIFSSLVILTLNFLISPKMQFQLYSLALWIDYVFRLFKFGSIGNGFFVFLIIDLRNYDIIFPTI